MISTLRTITTSNAISKILVRSYSVIKEFPSFSAKDLVVKPVENSKLSDPSFKRSPVFGAEFTDHLLEIDWNSEKGWEKPVIRPFSNFSLHPAAKGLHYGIQLFEGIKAFYGVDGKIRIFRLDQNMKRMNRSAQRTALPTFDGDALAELIVKLVSKDKEWVPQNPGGSLYIRPTLVGTDGQLGIAVAQEAKLFVILSPSRCPYYETHVSLLADLKHVRAFPGGVGQYKIGGNYAPTILISEEAKAKGCDQILWLYGKEEYLTEVGTMNIFIHVQDKDGANTLITPSLDDGVILPGVTRDSILTLGREFGFKVEERRITIHEVKQAAKEGRLRGVFGTGTAATITSVNMIKHALPDGKLDEIECPVDPNSEMFKFKQHLTDIYYGKIQRPEWTTIVE